MKAGDTIYLKPIGNQARRSKEIRTVEIDTIGRKYFTVKPGFYGKFEVENLQQHSIYSSDWQAYLSEQDILDEKELSEKRKLIKEYPFSLEQCRAILELIKC